MNPSTNKNKKNALGRGLGSLLGDKQAQEETAAAKQSLRKEIEKQVKTEVREETKAKADKPQATVIAKISNNNAQKIGQMIYKIAIEKVSNNKAQPRKKFDKEKLKALSESIKENGIIQPITVRKKSENNYEIVAGERRWRASQMAGLHEVPVIIQNYTEQKTLEIALIENVQRENLNPIEEAFAYKNLMDEFDLTQSEVAEKMGKERATVANLLRLIKLAPEVRDMVKNNEISLGHAKVLLAIEDYRLQFKVARKVIKSGLSVKQTNKLIKRLQGTPVVEKDEINSGISKQIKSLEQEMQKILGTKVKLNYDKGKSKLQIQFYTVSELNGFVNNLRDNWKN